jgi:hypothetical protein
LRLIQYFADRPLWYDEAMLSNNIIGRGFGGLSGALDDAQIAPLGFLYLEKAATLTFGTSEHALRLIPLVMGIAALGLFWMVASRALPRPAALLALALFAVSPRLVYYSAEVKQYSTDVAVGLVLILVALEVVKRKFDARWTSWLGVAGVLSVWLSQPVIFVLAGVFLALTLELGRRRDVPNLTRFGAVGVAWIFSFGASFAIAIASLQGSEILPSFWSAGFLPLPPRSLAEVAVWGEAFARPFRDPLVFSVPLLAMGLYAAGLTALARWRGAVLVVIVAAPVCFTMLAAGLELYPYGDDIFYGGRVLLFLVPVFLLPVAAGAEWLRRRIRLPPVAFACLSLAVIALPRLFPDQVAALQQNVPVTRDRVLAPGLPPMVMEWQDPRPVLRLMAEQTRPEDIIYVYTIAAPSFRYYAPRFGLAGSWVRGEAGGGDQAEAAAEIEMLRGNPRAWLFFAYAHGQRAIPFIEHASRIGEPILVLEAAGVGALLYNFD